jgi:hypothetical protein
MLFSLPAGTEMFHFPAFPPHTLCIQMRVTRHDSGWVPPFGHPGITAWLTAPPGLSRPPTSFIGSWCQGIHRLPLKTYLHRETKMLASTMHISTNNQPTPTANTHTRKTRQFALKSVIGARNNKQRLFLQDPTGCQNDPPSRTTARSLPRTEIRKPY